MPTQTRHVAMSIRPAMVDSCGLAHVFLVTFAAMSTIRFWAFSPSKIHDLRCPIGPWQTPFASISAGTSVSPIAYDVAKFSLERRASIPVAVAPIKLDELRAKGLYRRDQDPLASTEFTYSRFLTPALAGFQGWALFCDCDFLWLGDIAGLAAYAQRRQGGLLRAARLPSEGEDQDGRRGADRLSAQELVVADAVQLRSSRRCARSRPKS